MAKVTICIPVYNTHKYLQQCLDSVIQQTFQDLEIIIVNDASSSDLEENIILDYQQKDNRIKYIKHATNLGLYHARETAVFAATSPYIFFLDSDDYLVTNAIELLFNKINNTKLDFVYGSVLRLNTNNKTQINSVKLHNNLQTSIIKKLPYVWNMCIKLWKTSIVKNTYNKLYSYTHKNNITVSEDVLFNFVLSLNNYIKYEPITEPVLVYRSTPNSSSKQRKILSQSKINSSNLIHIESFIIKQLIIINIMLKFLQDNELLLKNYRYYRHIIHWQLLSGYLKHLKSYFQYITTHSLPDNISKNLNEYVLYELINRCKPLKPNILIKLCRSLRKRIQI
ncbi:Glycosyl transferase family 2 [Candidatus Hepatincola sp. Pdp]